MSDVGKVWSCGRGHRWISWKATLKGERLDPPCPLCAANRRIKKLAALRAHVDYLRSQLNRYERAAGKRPTAALPRGYFEDE